jgi:Lrp/AsnC family leucine-responsive transcriptional regulator
MDDIDIQLLHKLQIDGRATWAELGAAVKLTPPAAADRVHRLVETGTIMGISARVSPDAAGLPLLAFVNVSLARPKDRRGFIETVRRLPEILECHHVAGDFDFLLKVRVAGTAALDSLLSNTLKALDGVVRTRTTIALGTIKEDVSLPLTPTKAVARTRT